jgi:hypothetical protein
MRSLFFNSCRQFWGEPRASKSKMVYSLPFLQLGHWRCKSGSLGGIVGNSLVDTGARGYLAQICPPTLRPKQAPCAKNYSTRNRLSATPFHISECEKINVANCLSLAVLNGQERLWRVSPLFLIKNKAYQSSRISTTKRSHGGDKPLYLEVGCVLRG